MGSQNGLSGNQVDQQDHSNQLLFAYYKPTLVACSASISDETAKECFDAGFDHVHEVPMDQ